MSLIESRCSERNCKHHLGIKYLGKDERSEVNYCTAFPDGIPDTIAYGEDLHLEPISGDKGIQFEQA